MSKVRFRNSTTLTVSSEMDSILIGYQTGTFETEGLKGSVDVSGRTARVHVDGIKGYVDIDLKELVERAVTLLKQQHDAL